MNNKNELEYIYDLVITETWDCYNYCASGKFLISINGVHDKETVQRVIDLIKEIGSKKLSNNIIGGISYV